MMACDDELDRTAFESIASVGNTTSAMAKKPRESRSSAPWLAMGMTGVVGGWNFQIVELVKQRPKRVGT